MKRYERIGSSDAASILGKNPYRTRYDAWYEKVHEVELDLGDVPHIRRGNYMEPEIERYVKENLDPTCNSSANFERFDTKPGESYQISVVHPEYDFITGHPDGLGDDIVWEFKAPAMRNYDFQIGKHSEWSTWYDINRHGINPAWILQVHHFMMITGLKYGCLAIWNYDEYRPFIYKIRRNEPLYEKMLDDYIDFWHYVKEKEVPPAFTKHEYEQIEVIDNDELDNLLSEYVIARDAHYDNKDRQAELKVRILTMAESLGIKGTINTSSHRVSIADMTMYGKTYKRLTVKGVDYEE